MTCPCGHRPGANRNAAWDHLARRILRAVLEIA